MALNWNQIQARKSSRTNVLEGKSVDTSAPTQTTDLGVVSKLETEVEESVPEWRIEGVSPSAVDVISGKLPPKPEKPPLWPSKPRPSEFQILYENLDTVLDNEFILAEGLEETKPGKWEVAEPL